jgi:secreted trypsin-like serine protease
MYIRKIAHCQPGFLASLVTVFGEYDISGDLESKRSVSKNVKRVIVHRQYDAATFENDLAILELESPVRYDTHIGKHRDSNKLIDAFRFVFVFLSTRGKKHFVECPL